MGTGTWRTHWEAFVKSRHSLGNRLKSLKGVAAETGGIIDSCWNLRRNWEQGVSGDLAGRWCWVPWQQGVHTGPIFRDKSLVPGWVSKCGKSESQLHGEWSIWQETTKNGYSCLRNRAGMQTSGNRWGSFGGVKQEHTRQRAEKGVKVLS